jgi:UDP-N-acetyl-D-mannosaminuronic acid dehydrogenase
LAFKPNVDDLRGSPALEITNKLSNLGYNVLPVEPNLKFHPSLDLVSWEIAVDKADIIVFLVKHREFLDIDTCEKPCLDFCGMDIEKR